MAQTSGSGKSTDDVEDQIKVIKEDIAQLTKLIKELGEERYGEAAKAAREQVDDWMNKSREKVDEASEQVKAKAASIEDYVVEKPVQSAFIALLIGLLFGSMMRR